MNERKVKSLKSLISTPPHLRENNQINNIILLILNKT
jgi:hypothetical protein